jgi:hypothetical protein
MRIRSMLSLAVLLAACTPAAAPAPAPMARAGIVGDYTTTLPSGTWALAFHEGNHFVVSHNGSQVAQGPYRVNGDRIVFPVGETGPYACDTAAEYTWRVTGNELSFAPVGTDACDGRTMAIASRPFTRTP